VPVPTLAELLAFARDAGARLNLEIKNLPNDNDFDPTNRYARRVIDEIVANGLPPTSLIVQSFWPPNLEVAKGSGWKTALLTLHALNDGAPAFASAADYDVLSPVGLEQTAALAADLKRRRVRIDQVVSGSMIRQRGTADPIAAAMGCELTVDPRWDEFDSADVFAHHSTSEVREERSPGSNAPEVSSRAFQAVLDEALHAWIAAGDDSATAESWPAFERRAAAALAALLDDLGQGRTALVSTSGGVIAAICAELLGVPHSAAVAFNRVTANTGVSRVVHGRGGTTLVSFNEHAHLERDGRSLVTYR
jgi:broad specificity phosphatase PhoE